MKTKKVFFKKSKVIPIDKFFSNVLYDKKLGYYNSKIPFGKEGTCYFTKDIKYSSEIIAIWMISAGKHLGLKI